MLGKLEDQILERANMRGWGLGRTFLRMAAQLATVVVSIPLLSSPTRDWLDSGMILILLCTAGLCDLALWFYLRGLFLRAASARCAKVSSLSYPLPTWRYLILFQSWEQAASCLGAILLVLLGIQAIEKALDTAFIPMRTVLLVCSAGAVVALLRSFRASFSIQWTKSAQPHKIISHICSLGYVARSESGGRTVFRQNVPRLLQWAEGNIELIHKHDSMIITGPTGVLRTLQARAGTLACNT